MLNTKNKDAYQPVGSKSKCPQVKHPQFVKNVPMYEKNVPTKTSPVYKVLRRISINHIQLPVLNIFLKACLIE